MYLAQLLRAATSRQLSGTDWSVLVQLQLDLDPVEYRPIKINALRHSLNLDFSATARSVRRLVTFGYLVQGDKLDDMRTYRLRIPQHSGSSATSRAA